VKGVPLSGTDDQRASLIERCNQGDRRAWEEFYGRYLGLVSTAVRKYCRTEPHEIEDTVQEIFIQLFDALRHYDPARSLEAYILEIVRRVRISRYRSVSAAKRGGANPGSTRVDLHDGGDEAGYLSLAAAGTDQEAQLIRAEETHFLRKALDALSESCRKLLGLRYDRGLSYKEIAESLGLKEVTLRSQVQRCLSALGRTYTKIAPQEAGET
jgi:RNA polymerase sigma-70 factor, ECF subfamily